MSMGLPYGLQAMLKEGHKHFSGVEEAVIKNIDACKALSQITRTSMGPNGAIKSLGYCSSTPRAAFYSMQW
jgi:T-complex protein 1 subunit theta